jgi:hypothetical protein
MQIFSKKTALQALGAEHGKLTIRRDQLAKKTEEARLELQRAEDGQIKLLTQLEADDPKAETAAQRRVESATSTLKGLEAALAKIEEQTCDAQRRVDQERQSIERNSAADEIERRVSAFENTVEPALTAMRAFSKAAAELEHVNFETGAISQYAHVAASELEIASSLAIVEVRSMAASVRAGQGRIPRQAPPPAPPPPAPVVERVWTREPIAWTRDGKTEIRDLNEWVDLAPGLARMAIDIGAAVPLGHSKAGEQVASWRRWHGYGAPELAKCRRLDDAAESAATGEQPRPQEPRIVHSGLDPNFEIVDRGPGYTLKTHGPTGEAA